MMQVNERHRPKSKLRSKSRCLQRMCEADALKWRDDRFWSHMSRKPHSYYEKVGGCWSWEAWNTPGMVNHLSKCSLTRDIDNLPHIHPKPTGTDTGWTCFRVRLEDLILCPKPARTGLVVGPPYTTFTVFPLLRVYFPFLAFLSTILLSTFHLLLFPQVNTWNYNFFSQLVLILITNTLFLIPFARQTRHYMVLLMVTWELFALQHGTPTNVPNTPLQLSAKSGSFSHPPTEPPVRFRHLSELWLLLASYTGAFYVQQLLVSRPADFHFKLHHLFWARTPSSS